MVKSVFLLYFNYTDTNSQERHELQGAFDTLGKAEAGKAAVWKKYSDDLGPLDICYIIETSLNKVEL